MHRIKTQNEQHRSEVIQIKTSSFTSQLRRTCAFNLPLSRPPSYYYITLLHLGVNLAILFCYCCCCCTIIVCGGSTASKQRSKERRTQTYARRHGSLPLPLLVVLLKFHYLSVIIFVVLIVDTTSGPNQPVERTSSSSTTAHNITVITAAAIFITIIIVIPTRLCTEKVKECIVDVVGMNPLLSKVLDEVRALLRSSLLLPRAFLRLLSLPANRGLCRGLRCRRLVFAALVVAQEK